MYKRYAALPSDPEFEPGAAYDPLPDSDGGPANGFNGRNIDVDGLTYPPPFGLHANLLTCGIGLMTFCSRCGSCCLSSTTVDMSGSAFLPTCLPPSPLRVSQVLDWSSMED
jgi:hypothetical protein